PNGRTALVARVLNGEHAADVAMLGPRTRAMFKHPTGIARVLLLSLKPGCSAPLFGASARALTDRIVPLGELWGRAGSDLASKILAASSLPEMLEQISSAVALRSRRTTESASGRLARRAASLLEGDAVKIESVAAELGVTGRHLRRAFSESI